MDMRALSTVMALLAFAAVPARGAGSAESRETVRKSVEYAVSLDADGHIVALKSLARPENAAIADAMLASIRTWTFEPGRVDGVPSATSTTLTLWLRLDSTGGGPYRVAIEDARTGGRADRTTPPRYPDSSLRRREMGTVAMEVRYDARGEVVSAKLAEGSPTVSAALGNAALEAVRHWTFAPETVAGHPLAGSTYVMLCFSVTGSRRDPLPPCEWTPPGALGSLGEGASYALSSVAHLKSPVIAAAP